MWGNRGCTGESAWGGRPGLASGRDLLTDQTSGDPDPDTQHAAYIERVHSDFFVPL
jgi:hypothetical protein